MLDVFTKWKDKVAQYIDLRAQLIKLGLIDRASNVLSYFTFTLISLFFLLAIFIFLGMGMGEFFAGLLNSYAAGYFITAGIYILFFLLLIVLRKKLITAFAGMFVRVLTEDDHDGDGIPDDEEKKDKPD